MPKAGKTGKKRRPANDRAFKKYKLLNQVLKNKIKKLERHCKRFPNDKKCAERLVKIKRDGYKCRAKPLNPGSNPTTPKPKFSGVIMEHAKTAGQQLSELLGIPLLPKHRPRRRKPKVTSKKKKYVKA